MATNNNLENDYIKFASDLTRTLRTVALYPPRHPAVVYAIRSLYSSLKKILDIKDTFNISLPTEDQIIIEGYAIPETDLKIVEDLRDDFKRLHMESLTFSSGITDKELEAFVYILLMDPRDIKKIGDLNKVFLQKSIKHIKIAQFSYIKVKKGDLVLTVDKEKKALLDRLKKEIKHYVLGKIKKPEEIENLKRDIINTAINEFKENEKLSTATKNILKKLLLKSEDRETILLNFKDVLLNAGCSSEQIDKLINKIQKDISKELAAITTGIDIKREKVDRLKGENEQLRSKISQLKKEVDSKSKVLEELSKERKKITRDKQQLDNIVHSMADGLVVVDPQGNIVMLNPVAQKLLGINKESIGIPLDKTVKDEHLLTMVRDIKSDKDGVVQQDVELLSPDESTKRVLRTSSAVVEDHNGKTVGMVTILNDITRQKEMEKMKSNFVASVSHELRTPLATIQQNISLLLKGLTGGLNEDQVKFLNSAQDNIKRLKRLINDLLDSAAIEAGKFKLRLSMVNINEIINNVIAFLEEWSQSKNISIQTQLLSEPQVLKVDRDRIEQVLTNLLSNAMKFTSTGGKIFVSAIKRDPIEQFPKGAIEISVRDTGVGIAPEDIKRIFDKFERADAVYSGVGGTGLGLAICKEIVKLHGGEIWVESKLNEGSKFSFLLPKNGTELSTKEA